MHCFNPRPPLLAGESTLHDVRQQQLKVSIHARHCWRANPSRGVLTFCFLLRFNPRPPLLAGESGPRPGWRATGLVSIHARHCWRANPRTAPSARRFPWVSIHARHCWRANPVLPWQEADSLQVSIHARHCWRANPTTRRGSRPTTWFQSTPAIAGGRIPQNPRSNKLVIEFQSTPAIAGGRIPALPGRTKLATAVSIHARHCWRANPSLAGAVPAFIKGFNPRPPLLAGESHRTLDWYVAQLEFQSTPAIAGGRIPSLSAACRVS